MSVSCSPAGQSSYGEVIQFVGRSCPSTRRTMVLLIIQIGQGTEHEYILAYKSHDYVQISIASLPCMPLSSST